MQELLNNPAVQAGFAPFLVALIVAGLFQRVKLSGLSIIAGFAVTIWLASDFTFSPLTSTRKIVLLGLIAAGLGLAMGVVRLQVFKYLLPAIGGAAAVWVEIRILQQKTPATALLWGAGCAAYTALLIWCMDRIEHDPVRSSSVATGLGMGTGAAALVGASALLGQFGLALGSAAAAHLVIQMIINRTLPTGPAFNLPIALITGLTGCTAVLGADQPWYALPILAAIPVAGWLLPMPNRSVRIQLPILAVVTFAIASVAVYATWRVAGDVPF